MKTLSVLLLIFTIAASGQNTMSLPEDGVSPEAKISEIAWMEGHWKGEAFGGITEEIWSPPLGRFMMFSFKLVNEGEVSFYELGHIRQVDETLIFELKHFHDNLKGWEEKDEVQSFKLVKVEANRMFFEGFTFEKLSDTEINIYGLIEHDGSTEEVTFNYTKV